MFLCEVGMNNTLAGLLHPQADEKMFNFSKCSTRPLVFSSFPPPPCLFVSLAGVFVRFQMALICFLAFIFVAFVEFPSLHSLVLDVARPSAIEEERKRGARQPRPGTDQRPLHQPGELSDRPWCDSSG